MFRLLISLVTVGAVAGCNMENTEPSGVLVDPSSDQEVPEGVTVADVDHNDDGIIDIKDLAIVSKFFGQEVTESATASGDSSFCKGTLEGVETVVDNSAFRKRFDSPDGGSYVYALLDSGKDFNLHNVCIAVRFWVTEELIPKEIKIKAVTPTRALKASLPSTLTIPLTTLQKIVHIDYEFNPIYQSINLKRQGLGSPAVAVYLLKTTGVTLEDGKGAGRGLVNTDITNEELARRTTQEIPIAEGLTISNVSLPFLKWRSNNPKFNKGYLDMSPTEVRRKYFPKDIQ